jgi:para-aminobenzoate synthetase component 1
LAVNPVFISQSEGSDFFLKALNHARQHRFACWLNGNGYEYPQGCFPNLLAWGETPAEPVPEIPDRIFGFLGYDFTRSYFFTEPDERPVFQEFPEQVFFKPRAWLEEVPGGWKLWSEDPEAQFHAIGEVSAFSPKALPGISFQNRISEQDYLQGVRDVQDRILAGDVYELNLCQYLEAQADPDGLSVYLELNRRFPMPFSGWMKADHFELACASPERFLLQQGDRLLTQPIKGTAPRGTTPEEDEKLRHQLYHSEKERAENMMIVDLMRNDLARISTVGSVNVPEIFGIYSFPTVHQMISTVASRLQKEVSAAQFWQATFPMGSMTGAPKWEVMKWISRFEPVRRGAYSGAMGFIGPGPQLDLNVLIRTLFINHKTQTCGLAIGSAITIDSVPEKEWAECGTKARAMLSLFGTTWAEAQLPATGNT